MHSSHCQDHEEIRGAGRSAFSIDAGREASVGGAGDDAFAERGVLYDQHLGTRDSSGAIGLGKFVLCIILKVMHWSENRITCGCAQCVFNRELDTRCRVRRWCRRDFNSGPRLT
jgi:hypothetical protein